jgi:propanediol dehydratase large subunit
MIKHLVMFKLASADLQQREDDILRITTELENLQDLPGVLDLSVHQGIGTQGHWDLVLVGSYSSTEALDAYQVDPRHVNAVGVINPLVSDRAIVDYVEPSQAK